MDINDTAKIDTGANGVSNIALRQRDTDSGSAVGVSGAVSDGYDWWRKSLAGHGPKIIEDEPHNGFYRMRAHRNGPWLPVAIFVKKGGQQIARVAGGVRKPEDVWTYCAGNPVSQADAKYAFEHGEWPGDAPTIGDNAEKAGVGPLELLLDYMETARSWFSKVGKIADQKAVDQAANYAAELARLKSNADKERDSLVRPHLEAQRDINGQYKPSIDDADKLIKDIKRSCDAYLIAEKRRLEEEARAKYAAEQKAAEEERKRIEAERAKQMRDDPIAALTSPEPELPMAPPPPEPVKVHAGGQRGRRMGLRKETVYSVDDFDKVYAWAKDNPKVHEAVEKVAIQAAKAGVDVPGISKSEVEKAP